MFGNRRSHNSTASRLTGALFLTGALILAVEPIRWLVRTWREPAYDSPGGWIFLATAALFVWSVTSPICDSRGHARHAWWLLLATAVIRLVGQLLAINVVGALALAIDVYALGVLCGLSRRKRAVSPLWMAVLFSFSLPVERIFQRLVGYGLQHLSASGSCGLLNLAFDEVSCNGVEIVLAGKQVLVDLPCSGARGLVLLLVLFAGLAAVVRPSVREAAAGLTVGVVSALLANTLRIIALAVGIAHAESLGGVDVMAQPWHDIIGLAALAIGLLPLVVWARTVDATDDAGDAASAPSTHACSTSSKGSTTPRITVAALFVLGALAILFVPHKPVDVADSVDELELPRSLAGHVAQLQELSDEEKDYFIRYGGAAAKAEYGPHTLLSVRTSAPLRHLHAPDECLAGAGYEVDTLGVSGGHLPGASYLAKGPDGGAWRVIVTYVSDDGELATSISEVVWKWLHDTDSTWTAIQRFHPADVPIDRAETFDAAVAHAFDIPVNYQKEVQPGS